MIGDDGSVYAGTSRGSIIKWKDGQRIILSQAHKHESVKDFKLLKNVLYSCGRDGTVKCHDSQTLNVLSSIPKLPMTYIEKLIVNNLGDVTLPFYFYFYFF